MTIFRFAFVFGLMIQMMGTSYLFAIENKKSVQKEEISNAYIEPFGNVKWDSDPKDVLNKICQMSNVEKIGFDSYVSGSYIFFTKQEVCTNSNFDIYKSAYNIEYLTTKQVRWQDEIPRKDLHDSFINNHLNRRYVKNIAGKNIAFESFSLAIVAQPIKINNIDFRAIYSFKSENDITAGKFLDNKLPFSYDFEGQTVYGYNYLDEVNLESLSGQNDVIRIFSPEIINSLINKFGNFKKTIYSNRADFVGSDNNKLVFWLPSNGQAMFKYYSPDILRKKYKGKYGELLKSLTKKSEHDMSNAL